MAHQECGDHVSDGFLTVAFAVVTPLRSTVAIVGVF
jgi:hypothetical protein